MSTMRQAKPLCSIGPEMIMAIAYAELMLEIVFKR